MGTVLQVTVCGAGAAEAADRVLAEVERADALFSGYRPDSEVSRLAARAGGRPRVASPELLDLLRRAERLRRLTGGAFDVTVGPLVDLWRHASAMPGAERIERARSLMGGLVLTPDGRAGLSRPGMAVDLGGIAKGYALDRAFAAIGDRAALLDLGQSSFQAIGAPPDGPAWNLLVRAPDGAAVAVVALRDRALSVSATFGRSRRIEGRRVGHVIDPRTGRPVAQRRIAAVVAPSAADAEALSTALVVLGRPGLAAVERDPGAEALLVERERGGSSSRSRTSGWKRATRVRAPSGPDTRSDRGEHGAELPRGVGGRGAAELG